MPKYNGKELQALLDAQYVKQYSKLDKLCVIVTFTLTAYMAIR